MPPVVSITEPISGSSVIVPSSVQLEASATSSDSTISSVTYYYAGSTKIGASSASPYKVAWKNPAAGGYSITAVAKDAKGLTATSSAVALTVTQDPAPTVTLVAAPKSGTSLIGPATISLSATASSTDETIRSVTYFNGTKELGSATMAPYTYSWKNVAAATYSLTAVATDSLGVPGTSAPVSVTVAQDQAPTVSMTAVPAPGFTGIGPETIDLAATAFSPDETIASVTFYYNGTTKIATGKSPPYKFAWTKVQPGTYSLTAVATDTLGLSATSAPVTITVAQDPQPTVSVMGPASGTSVYGPTTIKLTASATSADESVKSVTYYYQGATAPVKIGTTSSANFTYVWSAQVGTYSVTAVATDTLGVTGTSAPVTITVVQDAAPSVSIVTPINGATYVTPASIGLSASATSSDVTISSVTYYQGPGLTGKLSTQTVPPYQYTWKPSAAGTYSLTAVAKDSAGQSTTSAAVTVNVTATTTSVVKITKPSAGTVAAPATVVFAATATAPAGVANVQYFQGSTLLGAATTVPYQFTWTSAPAGLYTLTAVATDTAGAAITSAPVSLRIDTPPTVLITTPGNGSSFIGPTNIIIGALASASVATGKITKVEFFANATLLGTSTTAPYTLTWTSAPLGSFSLKAEAFDSYGIGAFSPIISLQVTDQPPVISLATPSTGLTFNPSSNVSLAFSTSSTSAVSKVEIYRNGVLVATLTSPSSGTTWSFAETSPLPVGKYSYFARAYDATGSSADSATVTVVVAPTLPYLTDFEVADGFALGPLDGQAGWSSPQGPSNVTSTAYSGSQSIQLAGGSLVAIAQQTFGPSTGQTIVFCDFYALPTAEASVTSSTIFLAESAQFGFQQSGGVGVLQIYSGNGNGGGTWTPTPFTIPLNSSNQAQAWVRLTVRLDFTQRTWDIYANGAMVAYGIPFISSSSAYFSSFQAQGDPAADSFFDDMYIGSDNPLFADVNNDGIDDAWESAYGLSLANNDRNVNLSGDGIPVIQNFINNTSPFVNTKVTPPPVESGLILDLRADAGVVADASGHVSQWLDQSPGGNIAFQGVPANQPQLTAGQINGLPSLSFNGSNALTLPYNMMQNAQAGEIIGVVKVLNSSSSFGSLWNFGTAVGSSYSGTLHSDDFGTSDGSAVQVETEAQISQYYIYDTSIGNGTSIYRYNGVPLWTRTGLWPDFQLYPDIGGTGSGNLIGNIAEVMVFNRVLTDSERFSLGQYLTAKYGFPSIVAPTAPNDLAAIAVSSDTVDVSWTSQNPGVQSTATLYRDSGSGFTQIAQLANGSSFVDTGLTGGTAYSYHVVLSGYAGASGPSNTAILTTPVGMPDLPQNGLTVWLRSTVGTEGSGTVTTWADQSGQGNNAVQSPSGNEPVLVENQANGLPVVRFDGTDQMVLPGFILQNAQGGQIFAIVKMGNKPGLLNMLWNFGTFFGDTYQDSYHFDDFGTSDTSAVQLQPYEQVNQYFLYDTSIDASGNSIFRYDGTQTWTRTGLPVGFGPYPLIGGFGSGFLVGDIAEMIVYDRVLSPQEQATVYAYLANKFGLPSVVAGLASPAITSALQAQGVVGQPFTYNIAATNSPASYTASGLPDGLRLNPSTGVISGTPSSQGVSTVALGATNSSGTGILTLTLSVTAVAPIVAIPASVSGQEGQAFNYQVVAPGATAFTATGLPSGLTIDPNSGIISGTPAAGTAGSFSVLLTASNSAGNGSGTLSLTISAALTLTSALSAPAQVSQSFSYQVTTSNPVTAYAASGLPPGLSIDPVAGIISGAPTTAGIFAVTLSLTDATGVSTATVTLSVTPNFPVVSGMLLWLRSDLGVVTDSNGNVSQWTDQSGLGNNAFQSTPANEPQLVANQFNGLPAIQFNGANALSLPYNMMQQAQSGEIIAIVKLGTNPNVPNTNTLWNFGTGFGSSYSGATHYEDFGSNDTTGMNVETLDQIGQFFVYDTSIDANGISTFRSNGAPMWYRSGLLGGFQSAPDLGGYSGGNLFGDIVEVFVYDRVLTAQEQGQVYSYLSGKYAMASSVSSALAAPIVTTGAPVTVSVGQVVSIQVSASNGPTGYGATGLPTGLQIDATGLISGTPTTAGSYAAVVTATNASGTGSSPLSFSVNPLPPAFADGLSATGQENQSFSYQIPASNGPTSYLVTGLPSGLTFDPNAGTITGIPAAGTAGTYTIGLTAANSSGSTSTTLSLVISAPSVSITGLPYSTGFEVSDGFTAGPLANPGGWTTLQGSPDVTTQIAHSGAQSLQLPAGTAAAVVALTFSQGQGETIEFCDLYAMPAAETSIASSTVFIVEGAKFGFQQSNGVGVLQIFEGDGNGGGAWIPTAFTIPLGVSNQSATWVRLTARLDFTALTWSLYANGTLVTNGVPFIDKSSTYLSAFRIQGDASAASYVDDLNLGPTNPLFADLNGDGIPDDWETLNGLSLSTNDANLNTFSPSFTNLQEYQLGRNPSKGTVTNDASVQLNVYSPHD